LIDLIAWDNAMQYSTRARLREPGWSSAMLRLVAAIGLVACGTGPVSAQAPTATGGHPANRLARETSPYLLLHAHNPVDWYPWGPEAFAKAKAENKPIFLSIGYSSCYWCHVMERESFSDQEIARFLNDHFVCIKVDREERPDVDQIYMAALQAFGPGGWPMSMFLLADGRPFFGATYLPPRDRGGASGFLTVLDGMNKAFRDERAAVDRAASGLTELVKKKLKMPGDHRERAPTRVPVEEGRSRLAEQFDPQFGGFGFNPRNARRPKFPEPVNLVFLLDQSRRDRTKAPRERAAAADATASATDPLAMVLFTLDRMARGGIRDQLAGGYHRYSTDRFWSVPHFEKMLYDNAQIASVLVNAYELTGDARWQAEAEATFSFIARSMTSPEGGFYSAIDAETPSGEGAFYVWTPSQAKEALNGDPEAGLFLRVYGLDGKPNFEGDRYVLVQPRSLGDEAAALKTTPQSLESRLQPLRQKLLLVRDQRPAPRLDDKILTAWNGLMIAAYADAFRVFKNDGYKQAAVRAADFILARLREPGGRLLRTYRAGQAKLPAYLEDYAFLIHGLLRVHDATAEPRWLAQARSLTDRMLVDFSDKDDGGFFFTASDHESLLARSKDPYDGALPGGNSMAVLDLLDLHRATGEKRFLDAAKRTLESFRAPFEENPSAMPMMLLAIEEYLDAFAMRSKPPYQSEIK
jgi:uncharacterized protein YyaL (SSP411 family)